MLRAVSNSPVFYVDSNDPELAAAMARARKTFKYLWRELSWEYRRIVPALQLSAIKVPFNDPGLDPDATEHMWLSDITFDGAVIQAVLLNEPNALRTVRAGQKVSLTLDQLEDWMYVIEGRVYGGFTIQLIRAGMPQRERRAHDAAWGFEFAEPDTVALVPNWNARKNKGAPPGDPDAEHPMSENMRDSMAAAVEQNPTAFFAPDENGLNTLHSLALAGSAAGVRVLLDSGADPHARTKAGHTPRALAEMMDWPRVVELLAAAQSGR